VTEWLQEASAFLASVWQLMIESARSPVFYGQVGAVIIAFAAAILLSSLIRARVRFFRSAPVDGPLLPMRSILYQARALVTPVLAIITLGLAVEIAQTAVEQTWLIRISRGLAVVAFFYALTSRLVRNRVAKSLLTWVGVPLAVLQVFGWLDDVTIYFDRLEISLGDIRLSLLDILRTIVFGGLLFWLGAASNTAGKQVIRTRESWNPGTRELAAKLFEIGLFFAIFLLLLQIMGINLTALAVFGGALGIGLGFGLQQIASNFISGIIILLDRSITPGDFIELEDGRSGLLRELNMRHGILETYDGKDIMVPNEMFITSSYTNWTHKDKRQRYSLHFQVAYSTDLDLLFSANPASTYSSSSG